MRPTGPPPANEWANELIKAAANYLLAEEVPFGLLGVGAALRLHPQQPQVGTDRCHRRRAAVNELISVANN